MIHKAISIALLGVVATAGAAADADETGEKEGLAGRVAALEQKFSGPQGLSAFGIEIHGLLDASYQFNFNRPDSDENSLRSLDPDHNSIVLDMFQLALSKESGSGIGFGSKLDFGKQAERIASDWDGDGLLDSTEETNSFELQEAYATYTIPLGNGVDLKAGKFVTLHGAEVIEAPSNPNITRSFLFGFAIPFTHTGFMATYELTEELSITAGVVNGWDNVRDNNDGKSFHGNVRIAPCDRFSLSVNGMIGPEQTDRGDSKRGLLDVVAGIKLVKGLDLLLNYDYGTESDLVLVEGGGEETATWQGFAGIIQLSFFDPLSFSLRGEWFEDADGIRTGTEQKLWEVTLTSEYEFRPGLAGRIEYRHDESNREVFERFEGASFVQDTLAAEVAYVF